MSEVRVPFKESRYSDCVADYFLYLFLGVYNYVQIRNDTAVSVFLSAAYPDRKGAENILKQERKSEKPYDVCFMQMQG